MASIPQDFKVTFPETTLVFALEKTERKSIFLSNIDQIYNRYVQAVQFFTSNPSFPPEIVIKRLRNALQKVLVPYDFAAGRLKITQESSGRLVIDSNGAGVGFVVASSPYSLHDLGENLVFSNPGFWQLVVHNFWPHDDHPLCIFQVTSFKCGGFAIGFVWNHALFDGMGAGKFLADLATQAFDDDQEKPRIGFIPCNNRCLLAARSPPLVAFSHPEFSLPTERKPAGELITKVFNLNKGSINYLKDKANDSSATTLSRSIRTTYNVVAALVWRCKVLSANCADEKDRVSSLLTSMDIRARLNPPLPSSYCGNAILFARASAKCKKIEEWPFSKLVEVVAEGPIRFSDEYARSVIDLLEMGKGKLMPCMEYNVSSWLRLGLNEVVYPWGKPFCSGPVCKVSHCCFLFPSGGVDGGINVIVSLPAYEMDRFQAEFHAFFSC